MPVDIKDDTTIGSARLTWHDAPETTRAGSFTPGLEIDYGRRGLFYWLRGFRRHYYGLRYLFLLGVRLRNLRADPVPE